MKITDSPWGPVLDQKKLAPGIYQVSTASHGGLFLAPEIWAEMPVKETRFSHGGFYEEDCDWCWVALQFPALFTPAELEVASIFTKSWDTNHELQENRKMKIALALATTLHFTLPASSH